MRPLLPDDHKRINLAHLRRPCSYSQLPEHLQPSLCPPSFFEAITSKSRWKKTRNKTSFILLCATCLVDEQTLLDAIVNAFEEPEYVPPPKLHRISVPLFPPTSNEQAEKWSAQYWPTSFKNNNPYGPHPGTIARAELELIEDGPLNADACMRLARLVAADSKDCGMGEPVGVVLVERIPGTPARIVAVASDARYQGYPSCEKDRDCGGRGNITAHAVMRAIGMAAQKRRIVDKKVDIPISDSVLPNATSPEAGDITVVDSVDSTAPTSPNLSAKEESVSCLSLLPMEVASSNIFLDIPITEREKLYFDPPTLAPKGYLCLNLELYITHEPCIMCSMAILHSRFGRVIFEKDMRTTGALMAHRESIAPLLKAPIPATPDQLPPTKSAKRRRSRKNSKIRAIHAAIQEEESKSPPLEYGLWWRGQLNWKFLCWQWRQDRAGAVRPATAIPSQSSASSDNEIGKSDTSRRPSTAISLPSTSSGTEDLADIVKSLTLTSIPQSVHI
jgi:tRNA(Arg) A34 adenosine deaminase TadA